MALPLMYDNLDASQQALLGTALQPALDQPTDSGVVQAAYRQIRRPGISPLAPPAVGGHAHNFTPSFRQARIQSQLEEQRNQEAQKQQQIPWSTPGTWTPYSGGGQGPEIAEVHYAPEDEAAIKAGMVPDAFRQQVAGKAKKYGLTDPAQVEKLVQQRAESENVPSQAMENFHPTQGYNISVHRGGLSGTDTSQQYEANGTPIPQPVKGMDWNKAHEAQRFEYDHLEKQITHADAMAQKLLGNPMTAHSPEAAKWQSIADRGHARLGELSNAMIPHAATAPVQAAAAPQAVQAPQAPGAAPQQGQIPPGNGQPVSFELAQQFYQMAGADPQKARELAQAHGYAAR